MSFNCSAPLFAIGSVSLLRLSFVQKRGVCVPMITCVERAVTAPSSMFEMESRYDIPSPFDLICIAASTNPKYQKMEATRNIENTFWI